MTQIRAITIWEPYASCLAQNIKKIETRNWKTKYRGLLLIHAASRRLSTPEKNLQAKLRELSIEPKLHPGCIIAKGVLTNCIEITSKMIEAENKLEISLGNWYKGYFAWILEDIQQIKPIPTQGKQRLWIPDNNIIQASLENIHTGD